MKALRLLLALVLLLPLRALQAEIEERAVMSVDIPFAFTVEDVHLPAGYYIVSAVHPDHLWKLDSFRRGGSAFFGVTFDQTQLRPGRAKLIFNRYGTEYVLREIDDNFQGAKVTLFAGKREKQLARGNTHPEIAMVYARTIASPE